MRGKEKRISCIGAVPLRLWTPVQYAGLAPCLERDRALQASGKAYRLKVSGPSECRLYDMPNTIQDIDGMKRAERWDVKMQKSLVLPT